MLRSAASPVSVGFGRFGGGKSGLLMTPLPTGHLAYGRLGLIHSQIEQKYARAARAAPARHAPSLDLGFAELDVLLGDRVVFLLHQLVGHGARILSCHIIETGVGAGHQLHFDGGGFRHSKPRSRCVARTVPAPRSMSMRSPPHNISRRKRPRGML